MSKHPSIIAGSKMKAADDGWPELTYRYVEHYFWEPQHLGLGSRRDDAATAGGKRRLEAVHRKLRSQEVPLNYLMNVLLRLAPSAVRRNLLGVFGVDPSCAELGSMTLRTPRDSATIQPDVHLESSTARAFIELKVNAPLTLRQVQKYVHHHRALNENPGPAKRALLFLLVKQPTLKLADIGREFAHHESGSEIAALLPEAGGSVVFGSASWADFAQALRLELAREDHSADVREFLAVLIGDFLADLARRKLAGQDHLRPPGGSDL